MRYGSVCSGIEAATMAWHSMGWEPAFFSEIEKFPSAVLAHHYPDIPNLGDMTKFKRWPNDRPIDLLVGGTPCQSFSVAGLRKGLDDPRGNLALVYLALAARYRPRWVVWENVPGVLSSNEGRDFGAFLGALGQLGYGWAYRVLDAQFVRTCGLSGAVPQRRRRVFVVGYLGDWRRAAAVLFDRESMSGNPPPRRETGQGVAGSLAARPTGGGGLGTDFDLGGGLIPDVSPAMKARDSKGPSSDGDGDGLPLIPVAHALRGEGFDASEDGTGRGTPIVPVAPTLRAGGNATGGTQPYGTDADTCESLVPVAFSCKDYGADVGPTAPTLRAMGHDGSHANAGGQVAIAIQERACGVTIHGTDKTRRVASFTDTAGALRARPPGGQENSSTTAVLAFAQNPRGEVRTSDVASSLNTQGGKPGEGYPAVAFDMRGREGGAMPEGPHDTANIRAADGGSSRSYIAQPWAVRRLTPRECERLQGFPDDFTLIPWRGKDADLCPDGPRYKALGNSMAVNVMQWIGQRIQFVEDGQP